MTHRDSQQQDLAHMKGTMEQSHFLETLTKLQPHEYCCVFFCVGVFFLHFISRVQIGPCAAALNACAHTLRQHGGADGPSVSLNEKGGPSAAAAAADALLGGCRLQYST